MHEACRYGDYLLAGIAIGVCWTIGVIGLFVGLFWSWLKDAVWRAV